jgi:hypothetical protein
MLSLIKPDRAVGNLGFVICNFPDKPVSFWFRLVRARISILFRYDADSRATHPASSRPLKSVEEAPLSRGDFQNEPNLNTENWGPMLILIIPLSRGGAAPS